MIRSRATRMIYKKEDFPVRPCDQSMFHRGDVVIVNDNCRHYHGELQIVLKDMKNDGQRNLIGRIPEEEMILLDHCTRYPFLHHALIFSLLQTRQMIIWWVFFVS